MFPGFNSKEEVLSGLEAELHPPGDLQARSLVRHPLLTTRAPTTGTNSRPAHLTGELAGVCPLDGLHRAGPCRLLRLLRTRIRLWSVYHQGSPRLAAPQPAAAPAALSL